MKGACTESSQCPDGEFCYIPKRKIKGVCRRKLKRYIADNEMIKYNKVL